MHYRPALEPAFTVDIWQGGRLEQVFASDSFRECVAAFDQAAARKDRGRIVLRCGIRVLLSREPGEA